MKILIAVDDTKATREIFNKCTEICKCMAPESIILLYVEKFEGRSFMTDLLGDAELSTLQEVLEGTEYKEALDQKAEKVLSYYKNALEQHQPVPLVETMVKTGHPAEQIIETAQNEDVGMILIGSRGQRAGARLLMGSVSREVANEADRPVLIVK
ncbi:MAG: universal stress protein [Deltaproteobacteria bacterium]|jgi:nucleotide-binding universal stress UspA family protein|nr:universal stress protein [Deltaproteobacteria bacterium]